MTSKAFHLVSRSNVPYATFFSGALALLIAGGPYAWGVYSQDIKSVLSYGQFAMNLIPAIGDNGIYFGGFVVGKIMPVIGEFWNQVIAGVLTSSGYALMALTLSGYLPFKHWFFMMIYFTMVGVGSAFGYICPLSCVAYNTDPQKKGLVVGVLMGAFGLSAFFLARTAGFFFPGESVSFLWFCAIYAFCAYGTSALFTRKMPPLPERERELSEIEAGEQIVRDSEYHQLADGVQKEEEKPSPYRDILTIEYLYTWLIFGAITGAGLMLINSVSSIGESKFGPRETPEALSEWNAYKTTLVSSLSMSNFAGRVIIGIVSDYSLKKFNVPRKVWLLVLPALMCLTQFIPILDESKAVFVVGASLAAATYGATFSLMATYMSERFGPENYSMNWGTVTSAAGIMGTVENIIFGAVFDNNADHNQKCYGYNCYASSYYWAIFFCIVMGILPGALLCLQKNNAVKAQ